MVHIYQHPNYDSTSLDCDISVLQLKTQFQLSASVQVIPLPQQGVEILDNQLGVVTGWGRLSKDGDQPVELQQAKLPTISTSQCGTFYFGDITKRMFCAGYREGGKDACQVVPAVPAKEIVNIVDLGGLWRSFRHRWSSGRGHLLGKRLRRKEQPWSLHESVTVQNLHR